MSGGLNKKGWAAVLIGAASILAAGGEFLGQPGDMGDGVGVLAIAIVTGITTIVAAIKGTRKNDPR